MVWSWWRRFLKHTFSPVRRQRRGKGLKPRPRFRPVVEDLEGRLVPAPVEFVGTNGSDWLTPSNWNTGFLPGRFDDVVLDKPIPVTFSGSDPGVQVLSIRQTAGSLTITGGSLSVNAPSTFDGVLHLAGPGAELGIFGDPNDHSKPGQVTVDGTLTWDVGLIHGGTLNIAKVGTRVGTLNVTGVFGEMDLGKPGEAMTVLNNTGTVIQTGSGNPNGNLVLDNATINNQTQVDQNGNVLAVGTFTFQGDYNTSLLANTLDSAPKLITNSGRVIHGPGMGNATVSVPLNNLPLAGRTPAGVVDVEDGTLTFTVGGTGGGSVIVNSPAPGRGVINLTGGQAPTYAGIYPATGTGHIVVNNGQLTANGAIFNCPAGMFVWGGGTIQGNGLTNSGFMTLDNTGTGGVNQFLAGNLYNTGTITLKDVPGTALTMNLGALYNQGASSLFDIQTDSDVRRSAFLPPFVLFPDLVTGITNSGTFRKEGTTGTSTVDVLFNNVPNGDPQHSAVVEVRTGTLNLFGGGLSQGGTLNAVNANAVLDVSFNPPEDPMFNDPALYRGYYVMTGTYTGSGTGAVRYTGGIIEVQGNDLTFNFSRGLFQWVGGTIDTGVQNMFNTGFINLAGTLGSPSLPTLTGTLNNGPTGTITDTGTGDLLLAGGTLNNRGPQAQAGGTVATGTVNFQNSGGISLFPSSTGAVNNYGTISKTLTNPTDTPTNTVILAPFNGQVATTLVDKAQHTVVGSTLDVEAGSVTLAGGGNSLGGNFVAAAGGVLDLTGGSTNQFLSGTYTGSGTGAVVVANGTLNAGVGAQLVFKFAPNIFQWQGGTINTGTRDLANQGAMTITGPNPATLIGTITNTGTLTVGPQAPALTLNNAFVNTLFGGTVDIQSGGAAFTAIGNSAINNTGTFRKSAGANSSVNAVFNTPSGAVQAMSGTLTFNRQVTQGGTTLSGGTWEADNGAVLTIATAGNIQVNNATVILSGPTARFTNLANLAVNNGRLTLTNGAGFNAGSDFQNAGTLDLGPGSTFNAAMAFGQAASGKTTIHVGGAVGDQFGSLVVAGQATLNGALSLTLDAGATPTVGAQYLVVNASALAGTLADPSGAGIVGLQAGRNIAFTPQVTSTSITLTVKAAVVHTITQLAFVIGLDNQPYGQKLDVNGQPVGGYFVLQAAPGFLTRVKAVAAGHDAQNVPLLFAIGYDDQVYVQKFTAAGDQNGYWFLTKPGAVKAIAAGSDAAGDPELFAIGLDNQIYALRFDGNGNPGASYYFPVQDAPGFPAQVKSMAVTHDAHYNPLVFAIGLDDQVYAHRFHADGTLALDTPADAWHLTQPGRVKGLQAGFDGFLNPEVFVIGLDNQVYGQKFDASGNSVSGYFLAQVGAVKSLVVSHDANNAPELFVIGLDNQVYGLRFNATGDPASGYFLANPGQVKGVDVGYYGGNSPEVFVTGLNDNLFSFILDAGGMTASGYFPTQVGAILAYRLTP